MMYIYIRPTHNNTYDDANANANANTNTPTKNQNSGIIHYKSNPYQ
jgi:hypothetical protein